MTYHPQKGVWLWSHDCFKILLFAVMQRIMQVCQRQLRYLLQTTISEFDWTGFLIFVLVFVSHDFELDRNVSCEESTVSYACG